MRLLQSTVLRFRPHPTPGDVPLIRALALASGVCCALSVMQLLLTRGRPLLWLNGNLFLAWLPLVFALRLRVELDASTSHPRHPLRLLGWGAAWLLFFPNAPYLVTDFVHLKLHPPLPVWLDILTFMGFAWTGLLLGFLSLRILQEWVEAQRGKRAGAWFAGSLLTLCSYGVFMGRIGRWNSWDVLVHPFALGAWCVESFFSARIVDTLGFCVPMFSILGVMYLTLLCVARAR